MKSLHLILVSSFICKDAKQIWYMCTDRPAMSRHSTSISLVWRPRVDNWGNMMPLSSIYSSNSRDLSLSEAFSVLTVQFTRVHVPKTLNSMADVSGHLPSTRAEELWRAWSFLNQVSGQAVGVCISCQFPIFREESFCSCRPIALLCGECNKSHLGHLYQLIGSRGLESKPCLGV